MDYDRLTVGETAARLGVTTRTVRLWLTSGKLTGERVRGTFGPEWRISAAELDRLAQADADTAIVSESVGKLGGNEFRASVALLFQETGGLQRQVTEQTTHLAAARERLDQISTAMGSAGEQLEGLRAQSQELQRELADSTHARQRESQDLQATLQSMNSLLREEHELLAEVREALEVANRPRPSWWQRLTGKA
jgi:excisionase family DNA binding protein